MIRVEHGPLFPHPGNGGWRVSRTLKAQDHCARPRSRRLPSPIGLPIQVEIRVGLEPTWLGLQSSAYPSRPSDQVGTPGRTRTCTSFRTPVSETGVSAFHHGGMWWGVEDSDLLALRHRVYSPAPVPSPAATPCVSIVKEKAPGREAEGLESLMTRRNPRRFDRGLDGVCYYTGSLVTCPCGTETMTRGNNWCEYRA